MRLKRNKMREEDRQMFYHWCMDNATNGETLKIHDIEQVQMVDNYGLRSTMSEVVVANKHKKLKMTFYKMLFDTEKEALKMAIFRLKKDISELTDPSERMAPPSNKEIWLLKAKEKLQHFHIQYSDKWPELFI